MKRSRLGIAVQMFRPCLSRFLGGMFLCVGLALSGLASPVEEAGKLFALGRPAEAAALLDRVVRTNAHSSDLWFNLGQARSQAGEPGRAMVAWRRANRLDPRDGAVRAALEQVRQRLGTTGTHPLGQLSGWLRDEEWAALVLAGTLALGVAGVWRRIRSEVGVALIAALAVVQLLLVAGWASAAVGRQLSPNAVIVQRDVSAVQAPVAEARKTRALSEGVEVRALRFHGDWVEVSLDGVRAGWIPRVAVAVD